MLLVTERDALTTYRYLRVAMPVLVVLLGASVVAELGAPGHSCWLGSISAYYYTAARPVFVASLSAVGACLVIYHGNTAREDLVLNTTGMLAFVVAFVPTPLAGLTVRPDERTCPGSTVPSGSQLDAALDNNILALLVAASLVLALAVGFRAAAGPVRVPSPSVASLVFAVVLGGSWAVYVADRSWLRREGHLVASVAMFVGIVVVVALSAVPHRRVDPAAVPARTPYRGIYRAILAGMALAGAAFGLLALLGRADHAVFWLEAVLIVLFGAFWVVQSKELWSARTREEEAAGVPPARRQPSRYGSAG